MCILLIWIIVLTKYKCDLSIFLYDGCLCLTNVCFVLKSKESINLFFFFYFRIFNWLKIGFVFFVCFLFFHIFIFEKVSCNFFSQWKGTLRKYLRKQTLNWFDLVNNFRIMACWNTPWLFFFSCHYHKILCIRFGDFGLKFFI